MEPSQTSDLIDRSAATNGDRRRLSRRSLPLSGRWRANGRWVHVLVENISAYGAALEIPGPLPVDATGMLSLEGLAMPIPCVVCWSTRVVSGVRFEMDDPGFADVSAHITCLSAKARILMPWAPGPAGCG